VLLPTADIARQTLADGLVSFGATVDTVVAYRTVEPEGSVERATRVLEEGIDIASFTSSSTVRNLVKLLDGNTNLLDGVAIGCIGPITASTARELGLKVDIVARVHTIEGLLDALEEYFTEEDKSP
jgi:uroporphyrinogen III methyltransferase/synthase